MIYLRTVFFKGEKETVKERERGRDRTMKDKDARLNSIPVDINQHLVTIKLQQYKRLLPELLAVLLKLLRLLPFPHFFDFPKLKLIIQRLDNNLTDIRPPPDLKYKIVIFTRALKRGKYLFSLFFTLFNLSFHCNIQYSPTGYRSVPLNEYQI